MKEEEIFREVLNIMKKKYPNRELEMIGYVVMMKGEPQFTTQGYNLLWNLTQLCDMLAEELI